VETKICSDESLRDLDHVLNLTYQSARRVASDKTALYGEQRKWLSTVRDKCGDEDCLSHVYHTRIEELAAFRVESVEISESPLSNAQLRDACAAMASLSDLNRLLFLSVPGREESSLDENDIRAGWRISEEERGKLLARQDAWSKDPQVIYKLRLTRQGPLVRFAKFFTGGTCASYQIANLDRLVSLEQRDDGIDAVTDPHEEIRWAYWGGGDYPIIYRGRNFIVTSDLGDPNRVAMISWIKADGRIRPLCLLKVSRTQRTVVSAEKEEICSGIAKGTITPMKWGSIGRESLPTGEEFESRYGTYADELKFLNIDIEGSPVFDMTLARAVDPPGSGCLC
jgi:uncharacterized protein YecT (DUF1311 family)